ncbi:MAG: hypothetical protein ACT4PW_00165 [Acidimicrobiia bacterium]
MPSDPLHPPGDWTTLTALCQPGALEQIAADLRTELGRRDVAASYLSARLTRPVVARTVAAIVLDDRCPDPHPSTTFVHRKQTAFDDVAFTSHRVAVLAGDPAAGEPDSITVADRLELAHWWATRLVATLAPLLNAARACLTISRRNQWGAVAARVGSSSIAADRIRDGNGSAGWDRATELLDALDGCAPVPIERPTPLAIGWAGATIVHAMKGTCCLKWHTKPEAHRPTGEGYCTTCPLVDPACHLKRLRTKLKASCEPQPPGDPGPPKEGREPR